jgi:tripeptidyl-peptidase-1
MKVSFAWIALTLGAVVSAAPSLNFKVKERVYTPRGWEELGPASADHVISLRIGLPQPNFSELERHLYEVSDRKCYLGLAMLSDDKAVIA